MSMTTTTTLTDETLDALQELAQINRDSVAGFDDAAGQVEEPQIKALFRDIQQTRAGFAEELVGYIEMNGEQPPERDETSFASKAHRAWIAVKSAVTRQDAHAILAEAEKGEDVIKHKYEDLLPKVAGSPLTAILNDQYAKVKAGHDQVRDLRDAYAAK